MKEMILTLVEADKEALGSVRCIPGLQAAQDDGLIWVRGIPAFQPPGLAIQQLPSLHTYFMDEENRLFPAGAVTPVARLKELPWQPMQKFVPVKLPVSGMPGRLKGQASVKIVPSAKVENTDALLTPFDVWSDYVSHAPSIRLKQTRFAVSADGNALIIGDPLPPLPGKAYCLRDNILLPAGFDFDVTVASVLIAARLNPSNDALLLFDEQGNCEHIPHTSLVPSSRSAVRRTKAGGANE